jgi:hypothetical protein
MTTHDGNQLLAKYVQEGLDDIAEFIDTPGFQGVLAEFAAVPGELRERFIRGVLINPEELRRRGVEVPEDIIVQRSAFEDNRPTLFCVVKYLPEVGKERKKVTVTFDAAWAQATNVPGFSEKQLLGELH